MSDPYTTGDYPTGEAPSPRSALPKEPPPTETPLGHGWCCPVCSGCYAPWVAECHRCNGALESTTHKDTVIRWVRRHPATTRIRW